MKNAFFTLAFLACAAASAFAQGAPPWTIQEVDGSPRVNSPTLIKVSNGTLSCVGKTCTITTGGGGGGGCTPPGTANRVLYDDGAGGCTSTSGLTATSSTVTIVSGVTATFSRAGLLYSGTQTTDNASVQTMLLQGDRATPANNDEAYVTYQLSNAAGTQKEVARLTWAIPTATAASENGRLDWSVMTGGTLAKELQLSGADLSPSTSDGLALGTTSLQWSDLFLASGAVINFANGNAVLTHSSGILTVSTGDLRVTTAGTNAASVVTTAGTQTLTNKTFEATSNTFTINTQAIASVSGNTSKVGTTGAPSSGKCLEWDANGNIVTAVSNAACGGLTVGTTTVASGTAGRMMYETAGNVLGEVSGFTSDGTNVTAGSGNLRATRPQFTTSIDDSNGNEVFVLTATASAVNEITVANAATGNSPTFTASGGDTNVGITLTPKGTGTVFVNQNGTTSVPALAVGASNIGFSNSGSALQMLYSGSAVGAFFANGLKTFDSGRIDWSSTSATSGTTDLALSRFTANTLRVGGDTAGTTAGKLFVSRSDKSMSGWLTVDGDTANTNAIATFGSFGLDSTGTAAAGLGARLLLALESTTTNQTTAGAIDWAWNIATHASRNGYVSISAQGTGTLAEVVRFQGLASAVNRFDFFPSTAGNPVEIDANGSDTDIDINIAPKGAGTLKVNSTAVVLVSGSQNVDGKVFGDTNSFSGFFDIARISAPSNPSAGNLRLFANNATGQLACLDSSGGDCLPSGGGGGANTALSNLAAVAINTALLPGTDNSIALGSSSKRWTDLFLSGNVKDSGGNILVGLSASGSAVNYASLSNAATGIGPTLSATGSDSNVSLNVIPKGSGEINIVATPSSTNTTDEVIAIIRNSSGTPASNIGVSTGYYIGTTTTPSTLAGGQNIRWEDATHATRTSRMWFTTVNSGSFGERMGLDHNGIRLPEISSAATPAANNVYLYAKDSGGVSNLYFKKDDGTEINLSSGGGITSINSDTTAAQVISGGDDISASTSSGTTTISRAANSTSGNYLAVPYFYNNANGVSITANTVYLTRFVLSAKQQFDRVSIDVATGVAASTCTAGIYNNAGSTLLIDGGSIDTSTNGIKTNSFTATSLAPGVYWSAVSCSTATTLVVRGHNGSSFFYNWINGDTPVVATAANSVSGGALPSTTGSISASTNDRPAVKWSKS